MSGSYPSLVLKGFECFVECFFFHIQACVFHSSFGVVLITGSTDFERLAILVLIYFVALGIGAHVADNIGSKKIKPWGDLFSKRQSWIIILACLGFSYGLGLYYALLYAPLLVFIGIIEGFFLFAYNFELFKGMFHKNYWFALSWGMLPFLAGFVIQTNTITPVSLFLSLIPFILS